MRSIKFPKMFNSNSTNIYKSSEHHEATMQNTKLLLLTERGELFGDPWYGMLFYNYLFDQNSYILKDVIIDLIYTQVAVFIPQIRFTRNDIDVIQDQEKGKLYVILRGINQITYEPDTYSLLLFDTSNQSTYTVA
jgi:hypothetical protein